MLLQGLVAERDDVGKCADFLVYDWGEGGVNGLVYGCDAVSAWMWTDGTAPFDRHVAFDLLGNVLVCEFAVIFRKDTNG